MGVFDEFVEEVSGNGNGDGEDKDKNDVIPVEKKDYGEDFIDVDLDELGDGTITDCDLCHSEKKVCVECMEMPPELKEFYDFPVLNPIQSKGLEYLNDGAEAVIATSGTGTGKTVVLELGLLRWLTKRDENETAFILFPLKMLAQEKTESWKKRFGDYVNVIELTGDTKDEIVERDNVGGSRLEKLERQLMGYDVILCSYEMFSSLTTKKSLELLDRVGFLGIDEIHNLSDRERGGELEGALIRYMLNYNMEIRSDIVSLSATFDNTKDLGEFLSNFDYDAKTIEKGWSPIKRFWHGPEPYMDRDDSLGKKLIEVLDSDPDKKVLGLVYSKPAVEDMTAKINSYFGYDVAVSHHAGMRHNDRLRSESKYRDDSNDIRCLVATPTIAQGVNLPGDSIVIVCDYYDGIEKKVKPLSKQEVDQIAGRAGRPQYGNKEAHVYMLISAKLESEFRAIMDEEIRVNGTLYNKLDLVLCEELHKRDGASQDDIERWLDESFSEVTSSEFRNLDETLEFLIDKGYTKRYGDTIHNLGKGRACAITMVRPKLLDNVLGILGDYDFDDIDDFDSGDIMDFADRFYELDYTENFKDVTKDLRMIFKYKWMKDRKTGELRWEYKPPNYPQYDTIRDDMGRLERTLTLMGYDYESKFLVDALSNMLPAELYRMKNYMKDRGVDMVGTKRLGLLYMNGVRANDIVSGDVPDSLVYPKMVEFDRFMDKSIDEVNCRIIDVYPDGKYDKIYPVSKWKKDRDKIRSF